MKQFLEFIGSAVLLLLLVGSSQGAKLDVDLIWDADDSMWVLESDYQKFAQLFSARMEELKEPDTIEAAMRVIASLHKSWPKVDGFLGKIGVSEKKLEKVMDLFEELGEAHQKCDYHSFKILKWNFFMAIGRKPAPLDPTKSKLHSIVQQAWEKHADTCRSEHLDHFRNLRMGDKRTFETMRAYINKETIEMMFGGADLKTILSMKPSEVEQRLPKSGEFWVRRTYDISKGTVGEKHFKIKNDKIRLTSEAWKGGRDWPRECIEARITNVCDWIFKTIDIFRPVMFDFVLDDEKLSEITDGDELFEQTLIATKVCPALFDNRESLIKEVKKYVSFSLF